MQIKKHILSYRSTNPFDNRVDDSTATISPLTDKSKMPFWNVPTIQDVMNGSKKIEDVYPHAGGRWSPGEDIEKKYRENGDDYKRQVIDDELIAKMLQKDPASIQEWEIMVKGGTIRFMSFELARKYIREHGLSFSNIRRVPNSQLLGSVAQVADAENNEQDKTDIILNSLSKTFMVESINAPEGTIETGSAFCVYPNYFLTCAHVIRHYNKNKEATENNYYTPKYFSSTMINLIQNGIKHKAELITTDSKLDIALLKCDIDAELMELDKDVTIGNDVIAIGSPHGYENNVSTGNIGALNRKIYFYQGAPLYTFVDLAVFPGNSGGPVIKASNGKVVAMVTLIVSSERGYGLNAALPSSYIEDFCRKNMKEL